MKIRVTFDIGDNERLAINDYYGRIGKALHRDAGLFLQQAAEGELDTITHDYLERQEQPEEGVVWL